MSTVTTTTARASGAVPRRPLPRWLVWTSSFLAFPVAGLAGTAVGGRLDSPSAALLGGLTTGAVIGLLQALASSGRLGLVRWAVATALGLGVGLLVGAHAVGYGTQLGQLAAMGAVTGAVLGPLQALALPPRSRHRWVWASSMPLLWAAGWSVTTLAGIAVEEQFMVFGASGALTVTVLLGGLLHVLVPVPSPRAVVPSTDVLLTSGDRS